MKVQASRAGSTASQGACEVDYVDEARVAQVEATMPADAVLERTAEEFSLLSDPTRLRILYALSLRELCVCDLARILKRSMPATSQQLQRLRREGVVKYRMEGKLAYYRLESAILRRLVRDAFKRHHDAEPYADGRMRAPAVGRR